MTVEEILELMDELLDKSSSVPFSQKKMIDVEQMREYIDSIRLNLPGEIKRAKDMTRDKKNILTEANKEAEEIVKKAKEEAKKLVAQEEIIKQAADYAKQIAAEANKQQPFRRTARWQQRSGSSRRHVHHGLGGNLCNRSGNPRIRTDAEVPEDRSDHRSAVL